MTDETQEQQITAVGNEMSASFLAAKKRSDEILAAIEKNPGKFTMLTGDRPTGRLHLGHYFGSIRERVAMQNRGVNSNIIIADYQVITDRDTTEHIEDNVLNLVLDYMAAGIDPEKTMIFTHSAVPAENQLMLPFLSLVTEAELHRNPTVKSEMEASGHALTGLLLTYPVHQACDILFCKANVVPIGKDNLPHVEITRTIARRFNERYAKKHPVFPEPSAILSEAPEIPGLDGRKMSKSYGNSIMLGATAEETAKLIKKSPTDSERRITFDPIARPQVSALLTTAGLVTGRDPKDIAEEIGDSGAGALKKYVIESVNEFLAPHRERRAELAKDMDYIRDVLHDGNKRANEIANETLEQVPEAMAMGMRLQSILKRHNHLFKGSEDAVPQWLDKGRMFGIPIGAIRPLLTFPCCRNAINKQATWHQRPTFGVCNTHRGAIQICARFSPAAISAATRSSST